MKEIICPNCSQNIKIVDTIGHDLYLENLKEQDEEIKRLNNIIKEVREYIESYMPNYDFDKTNLIKLLEILQGSEKE